MVHNYFHFFINSCLGIFYFFGGISTHPSHPSFDDVQDTFFQFNILEIQYPECPPGSYLDGTSCEVYFSILCFLFFFFYFRFVLQDHSPMKLI
jgi:hypothetical protein